MSKHFIENVIFWQPVKMRKINQEEAALDISHFIRIEEKYDLYHIQINGVCPWMYFRFSFWNYQICKELLQLSEHIQKESNKTQYIQRLKSVTGTVVRGNAKQLCPADILFCPHPRRIRGDEYYECIYTDWLVKKYCNSVSVEEPYKNQHFSPVYADHVYYTDLLRTKSALYAKIHRHLRTGEYRKIYSGIEKNFAAALEEIGQAYHYAIPCQKIYTCLSQLVIEIPLLKKEFRQVLRQVAPRLIVEVVYYNKRCMVLNELAKELGIPTVELQHGTMHRDHAAYQFPEDCGGISQFPDYVFVFSRYWKNCVSLPIPQENVKVTGYPYFERQTRKYTDGGLRQKPPANILFVSQGTVGQELSRLASQLCELLDDSRYHIIYKLHPDEYSGWKSRTPWLIKNNIEVIDSPQDTIYDWFSRCTVQVGVYSTAIYEGLGFGLTTFIYNTGHADTMNELCEQGYATKVNDADSLYQCITSAETGCNRNGRKFWAMNAEKNICHEIDTLLTSEL